MFTGIVTHLGRVAAADRGEDGRLTLVIETAPAIDPVAIGDSISVQGTCLTVTAIDGADGTGRYTFELVPETLRRTTLGGVEAGDDVNLEPSLRVGDALGGHWVQGHVDGVGRVRAVTKGGDDWRVQVELPDALRGDVIPKGSVTIDGVSLTVGEVTDDGAFSVYLIPHTLEVTTLSRLDSGIEVNLEMDVLGRWIAHHLARTAAPGS